ncbi:hypothetical protein PM10SUCC1_19640 [Propionigenium maris DSM 9537]|uniref:Uncharacterized protein n=1 Tax=Propionigenium maris DSM 9537 TaxID=1123000 RepID=A0A9W6LNZ8_9FUSO|nr:hypothetical protein [Propionigenium maris]GLI56450.1 hypothetical protein PM10SUCC1_19640 [Propionigenium maris DSM 9537]
MKIYKLATLSIFLMTNLLIFGYVNPLGNLSLDEIQGDARKRAEMTRIAEIEEEMYLERSPRETQWLTEEEPEDARLIMYLDPAVGYGPRKDYELIEAIEYKYPDGTTRIVSYDGTLLKDK